MGPVSGGVLLTAFEPFDGQAVNASAAVADRVAAGWTGPEPLHRAVLRVSFLAARRRLRELVLDVRPDVVVLLGEAGGRAAVGIERVALNLVDARIPDDEGSAPVDLPVIAGAPAAYLSRLPVKACWAAAAATGAPVELSTSAGAYVHGLHTGSGAVRATPKSLAGAIAS